MNVFILTTGRSGSSTFINACKHIRNYTCAHESRSALLGDARFQYPPDHIEADNRLSWFFGRLDKTFGNKAFYVHLKRDKLKTAISFTKRYKFGIINAYSKAILMGSQRERDQLDVCLDYCDTVNSNIKTFLQNKNKKLIFSLENAEHDFRLFWKAIGAEGDLSAALKEWNTTYNATKDRGINKKNALMVRVLRKTKKIVKEMPTFIKNV